MTISQKLIDVNTAKQNIKTSIEAKGVDTTGVAFTDYHTKIDEIVTGGTLDPTPDPIVSMPSSYFTGLAVLGTITNFVSSNQPTYNINIRNTITDTIVSFDSDTGGNLIDAKDGTFTGPTSLPAESSTYVLEIQSQDFGKAPSNIVQIPFDIIPFTATARYFRFKFINATSHNLILEVNFYTGSGQTGTVYPPKMTANDAPAPYVATASYEYSASYAAYKAFDLANSGQGWWNILQPGSFADTWLQIDMGAPITINSFEWRPNTAYTSGDSVQLLVSDTGAFAGEETIIAEFDISAKPPLVQIG